MKTEIKRFKDLSLLDLYKYLSLRNQVFIVEQNCVYQDLHEKDMESLHLFYEEKDRIQAYLRVFQKDKKEGSGKKRYDHASMDLARNQA